MLNIFSIEHRKRSKKPKGVIYHIPCGGVSKNRYSSGCITFNEIDEKIDEIIWHLNSEERIEERNKKISKILNDE